MKLSIIIPVYNSDRYVSKCLESVFDKDLQASDFEVIVINDGSTDESEQVIMQFAARHQNLIYLKQNNNGVSIARNAGLDIAKGNYITFVDSDDEIFSNCLPEIVQKLHDENLDIYYPLIETFTEEGMKKSQLIMNEETRPQIGLLHERRTFPPTFYRKDVIGSIRFPLNIALGEDTVFNTKVQAQAQRVLFSPIPYYKYYDRQKSLSKRGFSGKAIEGFMDAIRDVRSFEKSHFPDDSQAKQYFEKVYRIFVTRIIELGVLPTLNSKYYQQMKSLLLEMNLFYILDFFSEKYPYINHSFFAFSSFQKCLRFKSKLYHIIHRA
jgi:glycosyltransferase involved in cell wall biosynthesis